MKTHLQSFPPRRWIELPSVPLLYAFGFAVFFLFVPRASAAPASTLPIRSFHPIETRMDLGWMGLLGASIRYSTDGRRVESYREFKRLIYPLHDEEASRLIRGSEANHFVSRILFVTGALVGVDVALLYRPVSFVRVDWIDRVVTGVTAAQICFGIGIIFNNNAEGLKFNAVQRYNRLLRPSTVSGASLSPYLAVGNGLGAGIKAVF